ncbi:HlyD family secretion protein [uncultured Endozoicomonas sp.]|uniref:HlyD family secretion protein n=1 Tax=uncultured Endozoicomonas sp. TaxID=432652 RepID=UPI002606E9F7|nr:HlyD family secretion protein [uncultured Endozoicomonas sp.]
MENTSSHSVKNWVISLLLVIALGIAAWFYLEHQRKYPGTDNAYVHGNIIYVSPQVGGMVSTVNAGNYVYVHEGELLVQIDPAPYEAQLKKARAAYEVAAEQNLATSKAINAASADVVTAGANLRKVQINFKRTMTLVDSSVLPKQDGDNAKAALTTARETVTSAKAHMEQLVAEQGTVGKDAPAVQVAAADLMTATLNLSYTNIAAAVDGRVGLINVHPGSVVSMGQAMFPLVEAGSFWVQANYKEDDLARIKPGMSASVTLDMYPDSPMKGVVESISPASGSAFSLLPPENATGNWVKITQRFPVSIRLDADDDKPLRVGASAAVVVDTVAVDTVVTKVATKDRAGSAAVNHGQ